MHHTSDLEGVATLGPTDTYRGQTLESHFFKKKSEIGRVMHAM